MTRSAPLLAALAGLLALGGCGQKGSLYLPYGKKSTVPAASPTAPPITPGTAAPSSAPPPA
jgi:predicted small lipoprotein YifL